MLGKLIKHEFKVTSRLFIPMYIALGVVTLLVRLMPGSIFNNSMTSASSGNIIGILNALLVMLYVAVMIGLVVLTYVINIRRFYTNMFGDEGYLMFTLPVTTGQLIGSKLIVAFVWQFLMFPVMLLSFLILFINTDILRAWPITISHIISEMHTWQISGFNIGLLIAEIILYCLVSICSSMLVFYLCIALGQRILPQHRLLGSVLSFLGVYTVESIIGSIVGMSFGDFLADSIFVASTGTEVFHALHVLVPVSLGVDLLLAVIYFFITHYLLSKKLNLN